MDVMAPDLPLDRILAERAVLDNHPVYDCVTDRVRLSVFMQHHIYSVWDFMSLIKYLHTTVPPTGVPWVVGDTSVRRFVNELLLEEESDEAPDELGHDAPYISHFELYRLAMAEVGADDSLAVNFTETAGKMGIEKALEEWDVPLPSKTFMRTTFGFIDQSKPHVVAAALAFGREHIIPEMFRRILAGIGVDEAEAPAFHYYLKRHIHLDEDHHGPLSIKLVELLCDGNPKLIEEAVIAARAAISARVQFWDGVHQAIENA